MWPLMPVPAPVSIIVAGPDSCVFHSNSLPKNSAVRALSRHPISKCNTGRPMPCLQALVREIPVIINELAEQGISISSY